jgi:hypothetical protein
MKITSHDSDILRKLGEAQANIAALPIQKEKAELWRKLNDLEPVRPMVWINEVPWHEMEVNGELNLQTSDPDLQQIELDLRRLLYQWNHFPADMVISPFIPCPLEIKSSGIGLHENVDVILTDPANDIISRHYHPQIVNPVDIDKIIMPVVTCDWEATEEKYDWMNSIFGNIIPVQKEGKRGTWFAPWDELVSWWGVEALMLDLTQRPEMVNAAISKLMDARLCELDQWESINLLSTNANNTRIGSGGFGYTKQLPSEEISSEKLLCKDLWGSATAQIFGSVSQKMHWEFALRHELRWLDRWGLTYYGCCEPLDRKVDILKRIPNLRKVSLSPWVDTDRAVKLMGSDYVLSRKPSPAVFAEDNWRPQQARMDLDDFLTKAKGLSTEIIMKDISTVRYHPERLWEWEKLAMEAVISVESSYK